MASIASWIYDKPLRGNYTFTHDEVAQAFPDMSAGRAATVLAELVEKLDFGRLGADFVKEVPVTSLQRLGYILDEVLEEGEAAESLYSLLKCSGFVLQYVPLKAGKSSEGCERNAKWRIIVNETIEIDEL